MRPCSLVKDLRRSRRPIWYCTGCGVPKDIGAPIDVQIQEPRVFDPPLNFIHGGPAVARCELLNSIEREIIERDLWIGQLYGPNGQEINDWRTFKGKVRLILRGSKSPTYRNCTECGRLLYSAMGGSYLYPAPPPGVRVFESHLYGLVVPDSLMEAIDVRRWPKLSVGPLPVETTPRDSLGELT
jgi:hypothetical protein